MPKNKYIISAAAKDDIKSIARYTIINFGHEQSLKYARGLQEILQDLAQNPELGKRYMAVQNKMLLRYRYNAHVIFYYIHDQGIFVVRVLGGMMHFRKHL